MADTRPMNPYAVLASALVLPGSGQVWNGQQFRGLVFLLFIMLLGLVTHATADPDVSVVGKFAGGIFVYAISVFDAYKVARVRFAVWTHKTPKFTPEDSR